MSSRRFAASPRRIAARATRARTHPRSLRRPGAAASSRACSAASDLRLTPVGTRRPAGGTAGPRVREGQPA